MGHEGREYGPSHFKALRVSSHRVHKCDMIRPLPSTRPAGITLRDAREIALMREAGRIIALTHAHLKPFIHPGISTAELNRLAEDFIRSHGATPTFLGYGRGLATGRPAVDGFPAAICTSLNDEVVHGIPDPRRILHAGDLLSIDVGVTYQGWVADSGWTYPVGAISTDAQRLLDVTEAALWAGIEQTRPGNRLGDVSAAVQRCVETRGFTILRELTGHGVGREMHEPPHVLNYGSPGVGPLLRPGLTLALETMVGTGGWRVQTDADGWTVRTQDGSLSAHFEHTIALTSDGIEILTVPGGSQPNS